MQDKERRGWGEKVKRSPPSDPQEKSPMTTKARSQLDGHLPRQVEGPGSPSQPRAEGHHSPFRRRCLHSPRTLAQRNHRETKHRPRGRRSASGPGDRRSALDSPLPGEAARARRAAQAPPSGPSPKCFRTCHPPSAPFSPLDEDARPP